MSARFIIVVALASIAAAGCNDDPSDAVETNVLRDSCEDGGPCDGGEQSGAPTGDKTPCDEPSDCADDETCGPTGYCAPATGSSQN